MKKNQKDDGCNDGGGCPIKNALDIIGGKWKPYIIRVILISESIRYNELKRQIEGITDMMLAKSLRELENDGIVIRTQFNEIPPRVEYSLTEKGCELTKALEHLSKWARK